MLVMFIFINVIIFCQIIVNFEFYGCNTFHKSWSRWQKKNLRKLWDAHQTPVRNIPQVEQANWDKVGAMIGSKFIHKQRWGEIHLFVNN